MARLAGNVQGGVVQITTNVLGETDDRKFDVYARTDMILIFHLGLSQRRSARNVQLDRFLASINKTFLDQVGEQPQFIRLILRVQRQIWIFPISKNPSRWNCVRCRSMNRCA